MDSLNTKIISPLFSGDENLSCILLWRVCVSEKKKYVASLIMILTRNNTETCQPGLVTMPSVYSECTLLESRLSCFLYRLLYFHSFFTRMSFRACKYFTTASMFMFGRIVGLNVIQGTPTKHVSNFIGSVFNENFCVNLDRNVNNACQKSRDSWKSKLACCMCTYPQLCSWFVFSFPENKVFLCSVWLFVRSFYTWSDNE